MSSSPIPCWTVLLFGIIFTIHPIHSRSLLSSEEDTEDQLPSDEPTSSDDQYMGCCDDLTTLTPETDVDVTTLMKPMMTWTETLMVLSKDDVEGRGKDLYAVLEDAMKLNQKTEKKLKQLQSLYAQLKHEPKLEKNNKKTLKSKPSSEEDNFNIDIKAQVPFDFKVKKTKAKIKGINIPRMENKQSIGQSPSLMSFFSSPINTNEELDPEKKEFIRKGAEFLHHAWKQFKANHRINSNELNHLHNLYE